MKQNPQTSSGPNPPHETVRHILGYIAGFAFFMILIPSILWGISLLEGMFSNLSLFPHWWRICISGVLFLWGIFFVIWSNLFLITVGKGGPANVGNVVISPLTRKLVTSGPYHYTRNPMVFGTNTVYLAIAIYLDSWLCLVALGIFFFTFVKTAIQMEEQRLFRDFGSEFEDYKSSTSMIIPLPPKK